MTVSKALIVGTALLSLTACARQGEVMEGGILSKRSACPDAGIPAFTGDVTLFNPTNSRDARAIDVVANIANLQTTCSVSGADLVTQTSFDVYARRTNASGARTVTLPYYSAVVRGGSQVVSKRVGQIQINFADGAERAQATGTASAFVDKASATLPDDIQKRITRRRKAGDEDAALDPMSEPDVRAALSRTTFELMVGFNLTAEQLQYNATR